MEEVSKFNYFGIWLTSREVGETEGMQHKSAVGWRPEQSNKHLQQPPNDRFTL